MEGDQRVSERVVGQQEVGNCRPGTGPRRIADTLDNPLRPAKRHRSRDRPPGIRTDADCGSPYPDIFTYSHMSAAEGTVAGYSNVAGQWGQVYCGEITLGGDNPPGEKDDIHVCQ